MKAYYCANQTHRLLPCHFVTPLLLAFFATVLTAAPVPTAARDQLPFNRTVSGSGSVPTVPDSLFTYEGIGNAVTGHETLRFVGRQGTGDLAGVHANITAEGDVGAPEPGCALSGAGTYTGHVLLVR